MNINFKEKLDSMATFYSCVNCFIANLSFYYYYYLGCKAYKESDSVLHRKVYH